jgi:hypothetical protein
MAQGSKSRVIIWTIVGILVVVAVIMLITRPKAGGGPQTDPTKFVSNMEGRLVRLEEKTGKAGLAPDVAQKIVDEVAKCRATLQEIQGMTGATQDELKAKVDAAQDALRAAKKLYRDATGKAADEGGE